MIGANDPATQRQAEMVLRDNPYRFAIYRLLQPCDWADRYLEDQATRDRLWPDDPHERNRVVCKIRR